MSKATVFCPGGASSQTGTAVGERYPGISIENCGKIPDVQPLLDTNIGPFVIPIWNSHEGEVKAAEYVWNNLEQSKIKLSDAWAKRIEFWFLKRTGAATNHGKIGSVVVAGTQCSGFIKQQGAKPRISCWELAPMKRWDESLDETGRPLATGDGNSEFRQAY